MHNETRRLYLHSFEADFLQRRIRSLHRLGIWSHSQSSREYSSNHGLCLGQSHLVALHQWRKLRNQNWWLLLLRQGNHLPPFYCRQHFVRSFRQQRLLCGQDHLHSQVISWFLPPFRRSLWTSVELLILGHLPDSIGDQSRRIGKIWRASTD